MKLMVFFLILFFSSPLLSSDSKELKKSDLDLEKVFEKEDEVIWGFSFLNESELIVTLRTGELLRYNLKSKNVSKVSIPDVHAYGQGGLLDVQKFKVEGEEYIYITYSTRVDGTKTTSLARALFKGGKIGTFKNIFNAKVKSSTNRHYGSRLAYDGKHIFMTVGDRGERVFAQDLNFHQGKVLRLKPNGKAAENNPFSKNGLAEIWTYGHRNPQGIFFDNKRKQLYSCEFGPRGGDELNLIEEGKNYGWPVITYGSEYYGPSIGTTHKKGMEQPLAYWVPSISPSGMTVYRGEKLKAWDGDIFLANLSSNHIRRVRLKDGKVSLQQVILQDLEERVRFIKTGPDGFLYFSTDSGLIYRIKGLKG